jgi:hypothetical protein
MGREGGAHGWRRGHARVEKGVRMDKRAHTSKGAHTGGGGRGVVKNLE